MGLDVNKTACLPNEVEDKLLDEIFGEYGFCSQDRSNTKQKYTKSTGFGPQGARVLYRWRARLDLKTPDQLLYIRYDEK